MNKTTKVFAGLIAAIALILGMYVLLLQCTAPTIAPLTVDPILELNAAHTDDERYTAELYRQAAAAIPDDHPPGWNKLLFMPTDEDAHEQRREFLTRANEAVRLALQASARPGCWADLAWDESMPGPLMAIDFSKKAGQRSLCKLFAVRAAAAQRAKDWPTVAESVVGIDRIARHTLAQATLIDALVGISIAAIAYDRMLAALRSGELGLHDLEAYRLAVAPALAPLPSIAHVFDTEGRIARWSLRGQLRGNILTRLFLAPDHAEGRIDRAAKRWANWADSPASTALTPGSDFLADAPSPGIWRALLVPGSLLSDMLYGPTPRAVMLYYFSSTRQSGAHAVLAVHSYHSVHGRYPNALVEIDEPIPDDPFSGEPFRYRRNDDGFILYSVGCDGDDDGGKHDKRFGDKHKKVRGENVWSPDGDFVFWPPQR